MRPLVAGNVERFCALIQPVDGRSVAAGGVICEPRPLRDPTGHSWWLACWIWDVVHRNGANPERTPSVIGPLLKFDRESETLTDSDQTNTMLPRECRVSLVVGRGSWFHSEPGFGTQRSWVIPTTRLDQIRIRSQLR